MAEPPNKFSSNWRGPGHGACNMTRVKWLSHVATEQHPGNASAFAVAFLKGCDQPSAWRFKDAATYFDHAWQPAQESCTTNVMLGGASKNSGVVDGSYTTCGRSGHALNQALAGGRAPCSVVSVGLNDDTSFEEALHLAAPSCCFRGYDGSLKGVVHGKNRSALAVRLPQFLRFNDNHFTARNWEEHRGTSISLFKIDCEGCEISILNPVLWLRQQICIEQILVEVHRGRSGKGKDPCAHSPFTNGHVSYQDQVMKVHKLLTAFDEAQLDVFWRARGGGPGGCILFGAVRRTPCP